MSIEFNRPLDDLAEMLQTEFAGKNLTVKEIYHSHHIGKRYIKKNYKEALKKLELERKVTIAPPVTKRRKDTLKDEAKVTFPSIS